MSPNAIYQETASAKHYGRMLERADMPARKISLFVAVVSILTSIAAGIVIGFIVWGWR